ncbi:hypothetical protein ACH5RR_014948 [Cinchona calisaya]|uniref:Uncharacterized protein n=1 Tax=Cinchona calisaya TaxID=153742 RepID=A0ABD2ZRQ2_9GENT
MAFYGYKGDVSECHWTPYSTSTYDYDALLPPQASLAYSSYGFNEPRSIEHSPRNFFDSYATQPVQNYSAYNLEWYATQPVQNYSAYNLDSYATQPVQNYRVFNPSEPRFLQYEPPPSYAVDSSSQTNYIISFSDLEFNEPLWEEYDPTPYGGGYDPTQTYGKPLPPSDEICYPRSTVQVPSNEALDGFSYASIPPAYGEKDDRSAKPADSKEKLNGEVLNGFAYGSIPSADEEKDDRSTRPDNESKPADSKEKESFGGEGETFEEKSGDVDEYPSSDYGRNGGYGYDEWNKQVTYTIPYGSGLESLDLCESIFGYWPCLDKMKQQRKVKCKLCGEESRYEPYDPWKSTADYLFGSPFVYGEQKDVGNGYYYGSGSFYQ